MTAAIAAGLEQLIPADIHVGITGLTAPGGSETKEKPVGTMFIHMNKAGKTWIVEEALFHGLPEEIINQTTIHVAKLLTAHLQEGLAIDATTQKPRY